MKSKRFVGIGVLLVFGFILAGCATNGSSEDTSEKIITITGLPETITGEFGLGLKTSKDDSSTEIGGNAPIVNRSVTIWVWYNTGSYWTNWHGTGDFYIECFSEEGANPDPSVYRTIKKISINSANTTVDFSEFEKIR
jgi:hypothetical protein